MFPELERPTYRIPHGFYYVYQVFMDLHKRRSQGFDGANLLTFEQIEAYERFIGEKLTKWERQTIVALDEAWMDQMTIEKRKAKTQ